MSETSMKICKEIHKRDREKNNRTVFFFVEGKSERKRFGDLKTNLVLLLQCERNEQTYERFF